MAKYILFILIIIILYYIYNKYNITEGLNLKKIKKNVKKAVKNTVNNTVKAINTNVIKPVNRIICDPSKEWCKDMEKKIKEKELKIQEKKEELQKKINSLTDRENINNNLGIFSEEIYDKTKTIDYYTTELIENMKELSEINNNIIKLTSILEKEINTTSNTKNFKDISITNIYE